MPMPTPNCRRGSTTCPQRAPRRTSTSASSNRSVRWKPTASKAVIAACSTACCEARVLAACWDGSRSSAKRPGARPAGQVPKLVTSTATWLKAAQPPSAAVASTTSTTPLRRSAARLVEEARGSRMALFRSAGGGPRRARLRLTGTARALAFPAPRRLSPPGVPRRPPAHHPSAAARSRQRPGRSRRRRPLSNARSPSGLTTPVGTMVSKGEELAVHQVRRHHVREGAVHVVDAPGVLLVPFAQHLLDLHALQVLLAAAQRAGE